MLSIVNMGAPTLQAIATNPSATPGALNQVLGVVGGVGQVQTLDDVLIRNPRTNATNSEAIAKHRVGLLLQGLTPVAQKKALEDLSNNVNKDLSITNVYKDAVKSAANTLGPNLNAVHEDKKKKMFK